MSFTFVKIPADTSEPVQELQASKAGGLERDELVKMAKSYFQQQQQANSNSDDDDHPSCEIIALSIPLPTNEYRAVSLYANDYFGIALPDNPRATQLVAACGHALPDSIKGDVFVGRAYDNEEYDWERVDFTAEDADATSYTTANNNWCRLARARGGGGGQGGSTGGAPAASLSRLLQQQFGNAELQGKPPPRIVAPLYDNNNNNNNNNGLYMYGMNGAPPVTEDWGSWTQSEDEVELKLALLPAEMKSKDCKIEFKRNQLTVSVANEPKLQGKLFGPVVPDECTYTIESKSNNGKELCISLAKAEEGTTWSWVAAAAAAAAAK